MKLLDLGSATDLDDDQTRSIVDGDQRTLISMINSVKKT